MMTEYFESRFRILQLRGAKTARCSMFSLKSFGSQGLPRSQHGDMFGLRSTCSIGRSERAFCPRPSMSRR
jgi:hypothetical protein